MEGLLDTPPLMIRRAVYVNERMRFLVPRGGGHLRFKSYGIAVGVTESRSGAPATTEILITIVC
jgi:hypothetical protein